MNKKKIKAEYIVLTAVIIFSFLYLLFKKNDQINYELPKLKVLETKSINKIEIDKKKSLITLKKNGENWELGTENYICNQDVIEKLLKNISNLHLVTLVSRTKNYNLYELDTSKRISVKAYSKDKLVREFYIGKTASTYDHTFVQLKDNSNVYQAEGSIKDEFNKKIDDLRDKNVLTVNKNSVSLIRIIKKEIASILTKSIKNPSVADKSIKKIDKKPKKMEVLTEWSMGNKILDNSKIDSLLNRLTSLDCYSFIYKNDQPGLNMSVPIFTIELNADKKYFLKIYERKEKDKGEYPAISSESKYPFFLNAYNAEEIMKDPKDFIKK